MPSQRLPLSVHNLGVHPSNTQGASGGLRSVSSWDSLLLAQQINEPGIIVDARLAACIDRIGQNMVRDGIAKVPFTIKTEVSGVAGSDRQSKIISDPATAVCIDLLAQNLVQKGTHVPFVIRAGPER